jgi:protocatechuate 3,4-dioxygenase beta subunit
MDNDDLPVGRILSRRQALKLFTAGGALVTAGMVGKRVLAQRTSAGSSSSTGLPGCVVRPAMTEGPYFVDEKLNRGDVRKDTKTGKASAGVPLSLTFLVSKVGTGKCEPRGGVMVDIWHCDAGGLYSDESANNTVGQNFLRGYQMTDANGKASFTTIYPGWYPGRAVHIHFKLRTVQNGKITGEFTSQLFFDDALTDQVYAQEPYKQRGQRTMLNNADNIYRNGGNQMLLSVKGNATAGYTASFDVGLNIA